MKFTFILILLFLASGYILNAQTSIVPFVSKISTADYKICQSGGEPIVSSVISKSSSITQGFLQPEMLEDYDLYVPNIFHPDLTGDNKVFKIGVNENAPIMISRFIIFDNSKDILFEVNDVDPHSFDGWWDGTAGGKNVDNGVYRFQLEYTVRGLSRYREGSVTKL